MFNQKLASRIAAIVALACALAFAAVAIFSLVVFGRAERAAAEEAARGQIKAVADIFELSYQSMEATGKRRLSRFKLLISDGVKASESGEKDGLGLPVIRVGNEAVNGNERLLTRWKEMLAADPALMILNERNELVRAATLLKDGAGNSMTGKPLATDSPEVRAVLQGQEWIGVVVRNNHYYVSSFLPIRNIQGKVVGAWSVRSDVGEDMNRLRERIRGMKFGETGYPYVMKLASRPEDATFIIHPKYEGVLAKDINGPIMDIARAMTANPEGTMTYMYDDGSGRSREKIVVYRPVPSWGWMVAGGTWIDEYSKNANSLRWQLALACIVGALFAAAAAWFAANRSLSSVHRVAEGVRRMGAGDFSQAIPEAACEIGIIAQEANGARTQIGSLLRQLSQASADAYRTSNHLDGVAQAVAHSANDQSDQAASLAAAVEELSVSISHTADQAVHAEAAARETLEKSNQGKKSAAAVSAEMQHIVGETAKSEALMDGLAEKSHQISGMARAIADLADQTNLLALNAAIEAARAGEAGRGFAVVADEVRKLAEKSAQFTSEIGRVLTETVQGTQEAVATTKQIARQAQDAARLAGQAEHALGAIADAGQRSVAAATEIAEASREQGSTSQDIARSVESIAQSADSNNQQARNMVQEVRTLDQVARKLEQNASVFRT